MSALDKKIKNLLLDRQKHLENRSVHSIADTLGRLSKRWLDRAYPFRKKAVRQLVVRSRFTEAMSHELLDALFSELTQPKLIKLLKSELKDPLALDRFQKDALTGKWQRARGPRIITHIFSGNVPNPSIISFILGMLVKSVNIGKLSHKDEGFLDIYLHSLRSMDRNLAKTNFLIDPSNKRSVSDAIHLSDLVVAYGNDTSIKEIKTMVPASVPFAGYGHRMSFGFYAKNILNKRNIDDFAKKTALDIWMMDRRGCLSPIEVFLEAGGKVPLIEFSSCLMKAIESSFEIKAWQMPASFDSIQIVGFGGRKMVVIRPVKDPGQLMKILSNFGKYLQSVSLEAPAADRKRIADRLSALGVNRICRAGQMQYPPITWHHDGKMNLASWLSWTDLET